ncbi:tubulin-folding cofactor E [Punica granatum]|uniref:Tubulin-folding cofactor E n=2 Tax=Punica granatum TaxID=22663 RepID=A0A6P8BUD2_PUNGR|nr:tubulin-folding cofactor E [Punica granatum]PKI47402.1 hypothetical protein CRG98_032237 [Punica granatum]
MQSSTSQFEPGQRVHFSGDPRRVGTVKYVGPVQGYEGTWVGVDWDNGEGKHDGSVNGVRYFHANSDRSGSLVRPPNLSPGVSLLKALHSRYRAESNQEENDEMYVLSASNRRVSVQLVGRDKIQEKLGQLEEMKGASLAFGGVSSVGNIDGVVPNLQELDMTGNLLSDWKDIAILCEQLPALTVLNLSYNLMKANIPELPQLKHLRILVLNNTGMKWTHVYLLKGSLPLIEELHLMGNKISEINPTKSFAVEGFDSLRLLNLEDNSIAEWDEILKLCQLKSLEQLHLNKNCLKRIFYPDDDILHEKFVQESFTPFQNLRCLLLGGNLIEDVASVDSFNFFPQLVDVRLSENPVTDPGRGGIPRFVQVARLAKVQVLNGSEVSPRERKESEIRYVRLVMSKCTGNPEEARRIHPRFAELKQLHGIEDERPSIGSTGPQKMASGLISVTLKCVGPSIGEKPQQTKKLPATTTVGKLKLLCENFFKLKSIRPKLFLEEEGSPLPVLLDDEMASLLDLGIGNGSVILVDEES